MKTRALVRQLKRWARSEARLMGVRRLPRTVKGRLSFGTCSTDEEGYSERSVTIDLRTGVVVQVHDGRDCDGRLSQVCVNQFKGIDRAHTAYVRREIGEEYSRSWSAKWEELSRVQRDFAAEAAGY